MGAVFISYRRDDSEGQARALSLELVRLLGKDSVFIDVDSIGLGRDFRQVLQERLGSCEVMIALIGPGWLNATDDAGTRRVDNPTDFVRQEIAAALKRNIPVIPVLLQGAQVPPPERLPDDLKDLSYRNGFELGHSTWDSDVREMVKRLGLSAQNTADSPSSPLGINKAPAEVSAVPIWSSWGRLQIATMIVLLVGAAGALSYLTLRNGDKPPAEITQSLQGSRETALPSIGFSGTTSLPTPAPTTDGGMDAAGIEFLWPGDDCWDIFRGSELVTYQCGSKKQALSAGRYTIKGKSAPVFAPVTLDIKNGSLTRLAMGGVFELAWPGDDCWDIFRGSELVTYQCGAKRQALSAGRYTIKGKSAPVFMPVTFDVTDGSLTRLAMGGTFELAWPGDDCWDIFRGSQLVTYQCGAKTQSLSAGRYTIKGKSAPVLTPTTFDIKDGSLTHLAMGGVFEFAWPGDDCWDIFRGSELVTYQCGAKKQALSAGRYTIKGKSAPVFNPFEITVTDGKTIVKKS